eukprot:scaffold5697_cov102-Isochrysis_galbana.AAC.3
MKITRSRAGSGVLVWWRHHPASLLCVRPLYINPLVFCVSQTTLRADLQLCPRPPRAPTLHRSSHRPAYVRATVLQRVDARLRRLRGWSAALGRREPSPPGVPLPPALALDAAE